MQEGRRKDEPCSSEPKWKWKTRSGIAKNASNVTVWWEAAIRELLDTIAPEGERKNVCCCCYCVRKGPGPPVSSSVAYKRVLAVFHLTKDPMNKMVKDTLNRYVYYKDGDRGCECGCDLRDARDGLRWFRDRIVAKLCCPDCDDVEVPDSEDSEWPPWVE